MARHYPAFPTGTIQLGLLTGGSHEAPFITGTAVTELVCGTALAEVQCGIVFAVLVCGIADTELASGYAYTKLASSLALTDPMHGVAVTELVQAAAQSCGRVQALQAGPPLLCCPHLLGAEGSTAATVIIA